MSTASTPTETPTRKYRLQRLDRGKHLGLSNDGQTWFLFFRDLDPPDFVLERNGGQVGWFAWECSAAEAEAYRQADAWNEDPDAWPWAMNEAAFRTLRDAVIVAIGAW